MIEIHFRKSTSKSYKDVIKHSRRFEGFVEGDVNILRIPNADSLYSQWDDFNTIFHQVKKWTGCIVYYNSKPLAPYKTLSDWFYSIQELRYCYFAFYKPTLDKSSYCNDGGCWGCKKLKSIERYIKPSFWPLNYWYNYGRFINYTEWAVNKEQIRAILLEEANQRRLEFCPAFSNSIIEPFINKLPDIIPIDNVNWRIRYITDFLENGKINIPEGIEHIIAEHKIYQVQDEVIENFFTENVNPDNISDDDANRMIEEYLRKERFKTD